MQPQQGIIIPQSQDRSVGRAGSRAASSRFAKWELPSDMDPVSLEAQLLKLQMRNAEYEANLRQALKHLQNVKSRTHKMTETVARLSAENKELRAAVKSAQTKGPMRESVGLSISF